MDAQFAAQTLQLLKENNKVSIVKSDEAHFYLCEKYKSVGTDDRQISDSSMNVGRTVTGNAKSLK